MVKTAILCIICHVDDIMIDKEANIYLTLPQDINILKCNRCGLRWLNPMPSIEEYQEIYRSSYFENIPEDYEKIASERILHFRNRIKDIKKYVGRDGFHLLDVGAATGEFVHEARSVGIEADGVEPSELICQQAKEKYGVEMIQGDFLDLDLGRDTYDVVHMNHVFEHLSVPQKCLEKVQWILRDDGILVIEVPNQFDNILDIIMRILRMERPKPFTIYSIHHPFFYNTKSLSLFLSQYGFNIIKLRTWRSYMKIKSGSFYPGASYLERCVLLISDLLFKGGLFIEIYARKTKKGVV